MTTYSITFKNETVETAWNFVVYEKPPPEVTSVAWIVCPVPPTGQGYREFTLTYGVALTEKHENIMTVSQQQTADLGKKYQVKFASGSNVPCIDPDPIGESPQGKISVWNNTNIMLDIGVTLSDDLLLVQENVPGNATTSFRMPPSTYYISLYNYIEKGQIIDVTSDNPRDITLGPVELQYTGTYTKAEVSVVIEDGKEILQNPVLVG